MISNFLQRSKPYAIKTSVPGKIHQRHQEPKHQLAEAATSLEEHQ